MPQGVVIEVRRGGHDALAKLSRDMARLGISGYIRIERRPKNMIPKVGQVLIHESQPKLAIHEAEAVLGGLEALLEIERDSSVLDALISLVELSNEEILRIISLYPDSLLLSQEVKSSEIRDDWWNYVQLNTSSWRREARLPEQEVIVEAPEYIRQLTKAKLQKFDLGDKFLNYGDTLLNDSHDSKETLTVAGILASHGRPVIVFSRNESRSLVENFDLPKASCVIMTTNDYPDSVKPEPDEIKQIVTNFLWENKQAIVVFSDIEYLLSLNEFSHVMNMFREIIDEVRIADHLMLVHCNLEILTDVQRHTFEREFEPITTTYLDNLAMDAESLLDHPICIELSEEELSWIEQQIKFSSQNGESELTSFESISGGASSLADEDISEAKENLDKLVSEWQEEPKIVNAPQPLNENISNRNNIVSNLVETAFSAKFDTAQEPLMSNDLPAREINPGPQIDAQITKLELVKGPRQALRIKRTKKSPRRKSRINSSQISIKAASNRNVKLPDITEVTKLSSRREAIDGELEERSSKIDDALKNMLTSSERQKSRELSQALNQKSGKTIQDIKPAKIKSKLHTSLPVSSDAVIISASNIAGSDSSKRRSRESASRTQNTIDLEGNYRKWATEYKSQTSDDSIDYADSASEEGSA